MLPRVTKRPGRGGLELCSHPVLWVPAGRRAPRRGWGGSSVGRQGPRNPGHWDLSSHSICTACCLKAHWQMSSLALGLPWDRTTILSPVELRGTLTQGHGCFMSSLICSDEEDQNKTLARQTSETLSILPKVIHQPGTRTSHVGGARLGGRGRGVGCSWGRRPQVQHGGRTLCRFRSSSWPPPRWSVGGGVGGRPKGPPLLQPHSSAPLEDLPLELRRCLAGSLGGCALGEFDPARQPCPRRSPWSRQDAGRRLEHAHQVTLRRPL